MNKGTGFFFSDDEELTNDPLVTNLENKQANQTSHFSEMTSEFPFEFTQITNPLGPLDLSEAFLNSEAVVVEKNLLDQLESEPITQLEYIESPSKADYSRVPLGRFQTAKTDGGKMFYFPITPLNTIDSSEFKRKGLLKENIHDMIAKIKTSTSPLVEAVEEQPQRSTDELWVQKYSPKQYVDLISDAKTNLNVISWIKQWDWCVFKKSRKPKHPDKLQRPFNRILLLAGRAGLGKTTLAHVAAKVAGYNTLEINASDDRTSDALKNKLKEAVESKGLASNGKPTLVVIDEIDGASQAGDNNFMKTLIDMSQNLKRPVICICNDLYAPVLRTLRQNSHVITVYPPSQKALVKRLSEICNRESLNVQLRTLIYLAETTDGDLRSCLNTLQFMKSNNLSLQQLEGIGQKDMEQTIFSVWDSLFNKPTAREKLKAGQLQQDLLKDKYLDRLCSKINGNGDYQKLMLGCFENYCNLRPVDPSAFHLVSDWIQFYDTMDLKIHSKNLWELQGFIPFSLTAFYTYFSSAKRVQVEYPKTDYENFTRLKANSDILSSLVHGISPNIALQWSKPTKVAESLSFILSITSPKITGSNSQLLKKADKLLVDECIQVMQSFGLKYVHQEQNGQSSYRLEPPINLVIESCYRNNSVKPKYLLVSNIFKQMIASEMDSRLLKLVTKRPGSAIERSIKKIKTSDFKEVVQTDFFGRPLVTQDENTVNSVKQKITFKFTEGFSNAVRQPLFTRDFK